MFPDGSSIGSPAPIAAAIACSTRNTSLARARYAESCTARFSTGVISLGTPITMRGCTRTRRLCAFWIKYVSIFSVTLKSAMTPSFIGLMATTLPGVRPSISFASRPTATTSPLDLLIATMEGSFTTMPFPAENTSVFAVPRSMARSEENKLNTDLRLYPFLFIPPPPAKKTSPPSSRQHAGSLLVAPKVAPRCLLLHCVRTWRPAQTRARVVLLARSKNDHRSKFLLGHNNRNLLLVRAAAAVLPDDDDGVLARLERLRKVPERPVTANNRHRLPVDHDGRARFRAADNFDDPAMNLRSCNLQIHLLRFSLRHQREPERLADFAVLFLGIRGRDRPEVVAAVQPGYIGAGSLHGHIFHGFREHRRRADT